jgi:hypothetical protein
VGERIVGERVLAVCSAVEVALVAVRGGVHAGREALSSGLVLKLHPSWKLDGVAESGAERILWHRWSCWVGSLVGVEKLFLP